MFVVTRKYRLKGSFEEGSRRVEAGLVPLLREVPGFKDYYAFATPDGLAVSVSVFATEEAARASSERAVAWAREHLADLIDGEPEEVMGGELRLTVADR